MEEEAEAAFIPWEEFISTYRPLRLRRRLFKVSRSQLESGFKSISSFENEEAKITERLASPASLAEVLPPPKPRPPELEIPSWEGKVSIVGRKLIALNIQNKKFLNPESPARPRINPRSTFDLRQELQLRISGNISDRVTVSVDYDDTKENKRDISIVYRGAAGEAVKEISFGDISLNLPQTQFTSYSKQLFGIKGEFDFKRARLMVVGSQTKGQFAIKKFTGQNQFQSGDIKDTDYIRRTYYNLAFSSAHLPIKAGSVQVWRDDRNPNNDSAAQQMTAEDYSAPTSTFTGKMDLLVAGADYVVDHQKGIIRFTRQQQANVVIAVDYTTSGNVKLSSLSGSGGPKILKTENDLPIASASTETGYRRELKTFYTFGRSKIQRDDGKGNFILKILEKGSRKDLTSDLGVKYPETIQVDFEEGTFQLTQPIPDPEVYLNSPVSKYIFAFEIRFSLKTYILQPNIVIQSEKVYQDGRLLTRDVDYFIDYDSGFLTFLRPESISPQTEIEATYEVAPFGSQLAETLLASRGEVDLLQNVNLLGFSFSKLSMGSSVLLQQAAKPPNIPDVRSLPTSYSIVEGDVHLSNLRLPILPLSGNVHGELAQSNRNPNAFGKALIESMEGIKIEDSAQTHPSFWLAASNPSGEPAPFGAFTLTAETEKIKTIYPGADVAEGDTQQVLRIDYDLSASTSASLVYVLSPIGLDFSNKDFLDLTLIGDTVAGDGPEISLQLGKISEDADGDGLLDSEDVNSDGGLNFGEDTGWAFNNPDGSVVRIGANNGRLDSEDLDKNGRLDIEDPTIGGRFGLIAGSTASAINFNQWLTTSVPLGVTTSNQSQWSSIKTLRLVLSRRVGGKTSGTLRIAKISATGNRWERPLLTSSTGTFRVGPVNNVDDPGYVPLYQAGGESASMYNELYGNQQNAISAQALARRREQGLRFFFEGLGSLGGAPGSASTRLSFPRPVNFQSHKVLAFFLYGPKTPLPDGTSFYFQFGSANDYYQYQIPLSATGAGPAWHLMRLNLEDVNKDGIADIVTIDNHQELGGVLVKRGNPNLATVAQVIAGIGTPANGAPVTGEVWFNDVFLLEPRQKKGTAKSVAADFSVPRWMNFGLGYKTYDQDFESPGQAIVNQGLVSRTGNISITRFSFLPINASGSKEVVLTPSVIQTGPSNLVSQLSEGRVERESLAASGSIDLFLLPPVSWSTAKSITDNRSTRRKDETQSHSASFSWPAPFGLRFIQSWSNSAGRNQTKVLFPQDLRLTGSDNLEETSDSLSTAFSMGFFSNRLTLAPNWRYSTVKETREIFRSDESLEEQSYPKSMSQSVAFNLGLRLFSWLEPSANFSSTLQENHRVEIASFTLPGVEQRFFRGDIKNISRQSSLSVSQNLDFARILPGWRFFRSFTHYLSYQITDGDNYENVVKEFRTTDKLWVRKPLEVQNLGARRTNLTLRDSVTVNSRWTPFVAIWPQHTLGTLSITNNYTQAIDRTETTGTARKSVSEALPDMTVSMSNIEKLIRAQRWMSSTSLSSRYSRRLRTTIDVDRGIDTGLGSDFHFIGWQRYDFTLNYSQNQNNAFNLINNLRTNHSMTQTGSLSVGFNWDIWRLSGKTGYSESSAMDAAGKITQDQQSLSPSMSIRGDFNLPTGLALPFVKKRLMFTNRVVLSSALSLEHRSSTLNVEQTNTDNWNWNLNGDFEIGKNLRAGLGTAVNYFRNRVLGDQDFYTYSINGQVVFQF